MNGRSVTSCMRSAERELDFADDTLGNSIIHGIDDVSILMLTQTGFRAGYNFYFFRPIFARPVFVTLSLPIWLLTRNL